MGSSPTPATKSLILNELADIKQLIEALLGYNIKRKLELRHKMVWETEAYLAQVEKAKQDALERLAAARAIVMAKGRVLGSRGGYVW